MYTKFYNIKAKPFEITPDPKFLYLGENHKEALAHLTYAVREKKGFTVITGEVGTGKTTLVQTLLSKLDGNIRTAYVFNPKLGSTDFLHYICEDLGLTGQKRSKGQYLSHLHHFLLACYARNENVVLIIDEAQAMEPQLLEEVRLLTNLETPTGKLLQVILLGQPELNETLNDPKFRQLKQRISLRYHIRPFGREETEEFIKRRLRIAGAADPNLFTPRAMKAIYRHSKGIPRLINILCDNALLSGFATDQKVIGHRTIREVAANLNGAVSPKKRSRLLFLATAFGLILVFAGLVYLWETGSAALGQIDLFDWFQAAKKVFENIFDFSFFPP